MSSKHSLLLILGLVVLAGAAALVDSANPTDVLGKSKRPYHGSVLYQRPVTLSGQPIQPPNRGRVLIQRPVALGPGSELSGYPIQRPHRSSPFDKPNSESPPKKVNGQPDQTPELPEKLHGHHPIRRMFAHHGGSQQASSLLSEPYYKDD